MSEGSAAASGPAGPGPTAPAAPIPPTPRERKFRQAAWVYLHVGILYEAAAYAMWQNGVLPTGGMGPAWAWLVGGAVVALLVFGGLYWWQNRWFARAIWAFNALRLPSLIGAGFFRGTDSEIAPAFYVTALVVVVINMAFLARAGWDL